MSINFTVRVVPAYGDQPSLLVIGNHHGYEGGSFEEYPNSLLLVGSVPPGEHLVTDLWDGISGFDFADTSSWVVAGDVNDDGHLDLWMSSLLHHGPFLGRDFSLLEDAVSWVVDDSSATLGGFDADGDGHEDVLFGNGGLKGVIHYGPFQEGEIAGYAYGSGFDPTRMSVFGQDSGCTEPTGSFLLRDHFGPGRHGVSFGWTAYCDPTTVVYDLMQPRGAQVGTAEARAWYRFKKWELFDPGDLDGDGHPDLAGTLGSTGHLLFSGPVSGNLYDVPAPLSMAEEIGEDSSLLKSLGDLDGDGVHEFLFLYRHDRVDVAGWWWGVVFSPYDEDPAKDRVLYLGSWEDMPGPWDTDGHWDVADLDGDGAMDLVNASEGEDEAGLIRIWYAKDLLAAYDALLADPP